MPLSPTDFHEKLIALWSTSIPHLHFGKITAAHETSETHHCVVSHGSIGKARIFINTPDY